VYERERERERERYLLNISGCLSKTVLLFILFLLFKEAPIFNAKAILS